MCSPRWGWGCPVASQAADGIPATGPEGPGERPWLTCPVCTAPHSPREVAQDGARVYVDSKAQHTQPLWSLALA